MKDLDHVKSTMKTVMDGVLDGSIDVPKGDVAARAGYVIVKAEETALRGKIAGSSAPVAALNAA